MIQRTATVVRWATLACFLASVCLVIAALPVGEWLELLRNRVEGFGAWAPLAYALLYAAAATLFVPGSALSLAAGLLFGVWLGTAVVWLGATAAIVLSFLVARYAARGRVEEMAKTRPRFAAVDRAIGEQGWKIVALMRLSPVFPFSLQNYLYGITAIGFLPCVLASAVFIVPGTFMYVYLGFAGGEAAAAAGAGGGADTMRLVLQIAGLAATAVVTVGIARIAGRAIASQAPAEPDIPKPIQATPVRARPGRALLMLAIATACLALAGYVYSSRGSLFGSTTRPSDALAELRPGSSHACSRPPA